MKQIAILGFGTVGVGVADILRDNADVVAKNAGEAVELKYVVDLRDMPDSPYAAKMVKDFDIVVNDPEVSIVVEAIGGVGAALAMVRKALAAGKSVVTSNKQLVAEYGVELFALAKAHGGNFLFEASVGGGIPVLNPMTRCLAANHITGVAGILNGTTNFILSQMLEHGETYESALRQAQANGYAEANPAADVEGADAARKICILSGLAFGKNISPADIHVEGITKVTATDAAFAEAGGMKLKLLGRTELRGGRKFCFVSPHVVPGSKVLAAVGDVFNAIAVQGDEVGEVLFYGPGAGRYPTASAVVADIIDIVQHPGRVQPTGWEASDEKPVCYHQFVSRWYVRTKEEQSAVEAKLGKLTWLPDQDGFHGGLTEAIARKALSESGLALDAAWPVYE